MLAWSLAAYAAVRTLGLGSLAAGLDSVTLIVVGASGQGKSYLSSWLCGDAGLFYHSFSTQSVTSTMQREVCSWFGDPQAGSLEVIDLPGFADTAGRRKDVAQWDAASEALTRDVKKAHGILIVTSVPRFTPEVVTMLQDLRTIFGEDMWGYAHIMINKASPASVTSEVTNQLRSSLLDIELGFDTDISSTTKENLERVPVYAANPAEELIRKETRMTWLDEKEGDELEGLGQYELVQEAAKVDSLFQERGVASLAELKAKAGSKTALQKDIGPATYVAARLLAEQGLAELNRLRTNLQAVSQPFDLQLAKMRGVTKQVLIKRGVGQLELASKSVFQLSLDSTFASLLDEALSDPMTKKLNKLGWLDVGAALAMFTDVTATDDSQLRSLASIALDADESQLWVKLPWSDGSPPTRVDEKLLRICAEADDFPAVQALLKDQLRYAHQLVWLRDLDQSLPETRLAHTKVFTALLELQKKKVEEFRNAQESKKVLDGQVQKAKHKLEKLKELKGELQPLIEEAKTIQQQVGDNQQKQKDKLSDLMTKIKDTKELQALVNAVEIPKDLKSKDLEQFLAGIQKEAEIAISGKMLTAHELIQNSNLLKGVSLRLDQPGTKPIQVVQIAGAVSLEDVLSPGGMIRHIEASHYAAKSSSLATSGMEKLGSSFSIASSLEAAMVTSFGVGALTCAAQVASAYEGHTVMNQAQQSQNFEFHSSKMTYIPMQQLELDPTRLQLTRPVLEASADIIQKPFAAWANSIEAFFDQFGTHWCPTAILGGTLTRTADFVENRVYDRATLKQATAACINWDASLAGSFWGFHGVGSGAVAASGHQCSADSSQTSQEVQEVQKHTAVTTKCLSNLGSCPSKKAFEDAMLFSSNWAVIDRPLEKCELLTEALTRPSNKAAFMDFLGAMGSNADQKIERFKEEGLRVYLTRTLDLVSICKNGLGWLSSSDLSGCTKIQNSGWNASSTELKQVWEHLRKAALKKMQAEEASIKVSITKTQQCAALQHCNELLGWGQCEWVDTLSQTRCKCAATRMGTKCETKIPSKKCVLEQWFPHATAHPIEWYQNCEDQFGKGWHYAGKWKGEGAGGRRLCRKYEDCQPQTVDQDCCANLKHAVK